MNVNILIRKVEAPFLKTSLPQIQVGDLVSVLFKVSRKIDPKDKKDKSKKDKPARSQAFEGVTIAQHGVGLNKSITIRRISHNIGVEKVVPIHAPIVENIIVLKKGKPRRAKLFYLRNRVGRQALKVKEPLPNLKKSK